MKNQLKRLTLTLILLTLLYALTACASESSDKSNEEVTGATTDTAENITTTNEPDITTSEETPVTEPATAVVSMTESEISTENEIYIPEGIDMNSTLSGQEWLESFIGNVNEPVVVVFNDETGRKEVVQANSEIEFNPDEDKIAVYYEKEYSHITPYAISIARTTRGKNYDIYYEFDAASMRSGPAERPASITVTGQGQEDWVIEFTILVK